MTDPRALLDAYAAEDPADGDYGRVTREQVAEKAFAVIRAVLDLHKPETTEVPPDEPADAWTERLWCTECSHYIGSDPWPCPTVQAVTAALEAK
ncbi:MAG TPA: hypothetical protein VHX38_18645 [Pseudonocardiaceae bacterium]|nr:hypothetical protein [Pseudonocardiaceae bacterium]